MQRLIPLLLLFLAPFLAPVAAQSSDASEVACGFPGTPRYAPAGDYVFRTGLTKDQAKALAASKSFVADSFWMLGLSINSDYCEFCPFMGGCKYTMKATGGFGVAGHAVLDPVTGDWTAGIKILGGAAGFYVQCSPCE